MIRRHAANRLGMLFCLLAVLVLAGCAGTPVPLQEQPADQDVPATRTTANPLAIYDPWEGFNRRMYRFNAWFDDVVFLPVLHGYHAVTPRFLRRGVHNAFGNIGEIPTLANSVLQLKPKAALTTFWRFLINTTVGLGGLFDPASALGLARQHEDLGQTLAVYGFNSGPYLVLPILGPSTLRDSVGMAGDRSLTWVLDPLSLEDRPWLRSAYVALQGIDARDNNAFRYYQTGSPFEYILVRFIYVNSRALQIAR